MTARRAGGPERRNCCASANQSSAGTRGVVARRSLLDDGRDTSRMLVTACDWKVHNHDRMEA
jgi:hypothetical protein